MKKSKGNGSKFVQNVYWERNMLALLLANQTEGSGWYFDQKAIDNGKLNTKVISVGYGNITFHTPNDFDMGDLTMIEPDWDGHSTAEKWENIDTMCGIESSKIIEEDKNAS